MLSLREYENRSSLRQKGTYRIMCLGESTTFCQWPGLLEELLNHNNMGIKFSVIDKSISGSDTGILVSSLENNLDKYRPDMVIAMMGINDRDSVLPYSDISVKKAALFLKSLRICKLIKLLNRHIINKVTEMNNPEEREIEMDPGNQRAYIELGHQYRCIGEHDKAEEIFKKAIEIDPKNELSYFELGQHYRYTGQHDKAEAMFEKVLETGLWNERNYIEIGQHYRYMREYGKIEDIFKKAIEIKPKNKLGYFELGHCYRDMGEYNKAEEMFKKAIKIDPEDDTLYSALALLYERQGDNRSAEYYFRESNRLRLGYYNPVTSYNYQRLKEILLHRGVKLVCVQYPIRSIEPLKKMLEPHEGIIFVDNEMVFRKALKESNYDEYFRDIFAGDFGHCTDKGNELLAENIANVILKEHFNN